MAIGFSSLYKTIRWPEYESGGSVSIPSGWTITAINSTTGTITVSSGEPEKQEETHNEWGECAP
jgi:hypothetical protein